ncbi:MAG: adenylate/guanylate cyclase domain-containing protein, partial [Spirochaetales bacterium]|nr:adenylate/guanylate cyclase domain-containing protein [Spirochaetales bacterium]
MSIRAKIILIVLPLLASTLLISGFISQFSARNGMTRIAIESLGFKAEELRKYADNQWSLLVNNDLSDREEYVEVAKKAVGSFASTIIRSDTELIFAVNGDTDVVAATTATELAVDEEFRLKQLYKDRKEGWVELKAGGRDRVGNAFFFEAFSWYMLVTEDEKTFYREVTQIQRQSYIVLSASLLLSLILLLMFTNYLTQPLRRVAGAMRDIITDNDMSRRVEVEFQDEIGELAHTFNIMVNQLEKAYAQIKDFAFQAVLAQKNERKVRNIFQKYVPKDVIDSLFMNPEQMLVGDNRVLAILFSDIRSFTTISEGFMPDELVKSLNQYFGILVDIIMSRGGIVDKYIGDAIMAFFGAPVKHDNDAEEAVRTALEMQAALALFNKKQMELGKPPFKTGIGVNYGVVTVGNIGSEKKMDYTIIGDMVNLGSRLEGLTKVYKQEVIFSESVFRKVREKIPCRMIDKVVVKGKTQGEKIYIAALKLSDREQKAWLYHHKGLKHYYGRDFKNAVSFFEATIKLLSEDHVADIFLKRCEKYMKNPPPPEWDG